MPQILVVLLFLPSLKLNLFFYDNVNGHVVLPNFVLKSSALKKKYLPVVRKIFLLFKLYIPASVELFH